MKFGPVVCFHDTRSGLFTSPRTTGAAEEVLQKEGGRELPQSRKELAAEDAAAAGISRVQVTLQEEATTKD